MPFKKSLSLLLCLILPAGIHLTAQPADNPKAILALMKKVADWQLAHPKHEAWDWTNGALYAGIMALGQQVKTDKYYQEMIRIAEKNQWKEGPRRYLADDYCVGWTYCLLYDIYRKPHMITPMKDLGDSIIAKPHEESLELKNNIEMREWAWCDALFMGPPTLAALSHSTGEIKYLDIANKLWWKTTDYLYDPEEHLFFRDSRYFNQREANGKKIFWSRGNGWVFAGLARVLSKMPADYPDRPRYIQLYQEMAEKLRTLQTPDGTWHASLLDPDRFRSRETSGTSFFCFGLAWGINQGLLDRKTYLPTVRKAWKALTGCVHPDGKLGYVQPIGGSPVDPKFEDTEVYGVGGFLLAGSEMIRLKKP